MIRRTLLLALVLASSCKRDAPKGDLPPATSWSSGSAAQAPAEGAVNPHAAMPGNPHGGSPGPVDSSAPMPNDSVHSGLGGGGGGDPHAGSVPEKTPPRALDKLPDGRLALGPFSLAAPAGWTMKPITSSMRAADFLLPGKPGADAELVVYYFGPDGAGSVQDNLDRWLDQFEQPDGKSSREAAKVEKTKFAGQDATYVSVTGRYVAQAMPGAAEAVDKTDQSLLAAIIASPSGPYYFKLVGAKSTIDAQTKAFRGMLESLKLR